MESTAGRRLALAACSSALLVAAAFAVALTGWRGSSSGVTFAATAAAPASSPAPAPLDPPDGGDRATADGDRGAPEASPATRRDRLVAQVQAVLPGTFLDAEEAAGLGLTIVANAIDQQNPPRADALFTTPLPGQTPGSVLVGEFTAAGFVAGHAQTFQRRLGDTARVGVVAWAFATEDGAQRAFRALRDLSGRAGRPTDFAPSASTFQDGGIWELLWVRGRLLLRASAVTRADAAKDYAALGELVAQRVDARSATAARPPAPEPEPVIVAVEPVAERLLTLRVPDLALPGGLNTDPRTLSGDAVFREPSAGVGASAPLLAALTRAGFIAGIVQTVRVAGQPSARFGLTSRLFPDEASARQALRSVVASHRASRRARSDLFPGAWVLRGPNGDNYSDLWWVRGPLLLQAGVYSRADVPQRPEVRDGLARLLDARAAAW